MKTVIIFLKFKINLDDFKNNDKKKNLRGYFWEWSNELVNRMWSVYSLVWFLCLMAFQPSWVTQCQSHLWEKQQWYYSTDSWEEKGCLYVSKGH